MASEKTSFWRGAFVGGLTIGTPVYLFDIFKDEVRAGIVGVAAWLWWDRLLLFLVVAATFASLGTRLGGRRRSATAVRAALVNAVLVKVDAAIPPFGFAEDPRCLRLTVTLLNSAALGLRPKVDVFRASTALGSFRHKFEVNSPAVGSNEEGDLSFSCEEKLIPAAYNAWASAITPNDPPMLYVDSIQIVTEERTFRGPPVVYPVLLKAPWPGPPPKPHV